MKLGVHLQTQHRLQAIHEDHVSLSHAITGTIDRLAADAVVLVTDRFPNNSLNQDLKPGFAKGKLESLRVIGDAEAPHLIAQAVFSGHLAGREFDSRITSDTPFRIERTNF
jgi:dimethylamine/trimethylamine dehydrogenase